MTPDELKAKFTPRDKPLKVLEQRPQAYVARFSPCGKILAAAGFDGQIHRWDFGGAEMGNLAPIAGHDGWVSDLAFDTSNQWIYASDSYGNLSCRNYLDPQAVPRWQVSQGHNGWIQSLAMSADGKLLATAGNDRQVRIWKSETGERIHDLSGHSDPVFKVAFHPQGQAAVSGDLKGNVRVWDLIIGQSPRQFNASTLFKVDRLQDTGGVRALAFNPDGTLLAVGGTKPSVGGNVQGIPTVLLFDWASGELKHTLELGAVGDVFVWDLRFHPAGFLMAAISGNPGVGKLIFRRIEDKDPFVALTGMANCHAFSLHPDGKRLAVAATNGGSNGNGRQLDKSGEYPDNFSPIHILELPNA